MKCVACLFVFAFCFLGSQPVNAQEFTESQLARWLKRFPEADANRDGKLTVAEARTFRKKRQKSNGGVKRNFKVDPGWQMDRFPEHALCYKSPEEIAELYSGIAKGKTAVVRYEKPKDGSLRIVGTGHSFMRPGYSTFPAIAKASGLKQPPLLTHTGGGMTGSARYKWEEENGIFQFDGRPKPMLLASISNSQWDAMMWGPYFNDRPEYYSCWIDFCLKYNPDMKFYLSDAWPQLESGQSPETSGEQEPICFTRRRRKISNLARGQEWQYAGWRSTTLCEGNFNLQKVD